MSDTVSRLLDTAGTSTWAGLPSKTIRRAVHRGDLEAVRIGREMFFKREEVERFIARLPTWSAASRAVS